MTIRHPVRSCLWQIRRKPFNCMIFVGAILCIIILTRYCRESWDGDGDDTPSLMTSHDNEDHRFGGAQKYRRPAFPLNCTTTPNSPYPDRYCTWNKNLKDCLEMLHQTMNKTDSWVFLGGPEVATLAHYVSMKWQSSFPSSAPEFHVTSRRNPCQNLLYYELPPPNHDWVPPDPSKGEGPVQFGLENPYCMDCKKCWNVLIESESAYPPSSSPRPTFPPSSTGIDAGTNATFKERHRTIEYLVVEYARDVSIQTLVTSTTQETAAYYLGLKRPDVCVVSVGLWDAAIHPPVPQSLFVTNVERYISLLQRVCHNVVWISVPAVVEDVSIRQTNCRLQEWNAGIVTMLQSRDFNNVYVLDIWDKSMETDHVGFVELHRKWYASLARLFATVMFGQGVENDLDKNRRAYQ
jgi:hypothetical protein